jgi:hypothetical protein
MRGLRPFSADGARTTDRRRRPDGFPDRSAPRLDLPDMFRVGPTTAG